LAIIWRRLRLGYWWKSLGWGCHQGFLAKR